jgi:cobalt/nickel transport system permease protein
LSKRPSNRVFFVSVVLVSLVVAGVVSFYASGHPDGLNHVAEKTGFIDAEKPHHTSDSPFAGYSTKGVEDSRLSGGLAGVVGVLIMLGLLGPVRVRPRRQQQGLMGAGHGHRLFFPGHSPVHRAPAHLKLLALLGFMLVVVATPRTWYAAYAVESVVLVVVVLVTRVPLTYLLPRMVVELPFVVFAVLVPFISHGPRTEVLGLTVSEPGLVAAIALLVKGTLGVLASLTLAATTEPHDLLGGLQRLRMPDLIVQIMGFMIRYLDVVTDEFSRMMTALRSRGCDPRSPRHWPVLARSLGALFIRSYERGERVHLAMLSRGYDGRLPQ